MVGVPEVFDFDARFVADAREIVEELARVIVELVAPRIDVQCLHAGREQPLDFAGDLRLGRETSLEGLEPLLALALRGGTRKRSQQGLAGSREPQFHEHPFVHVAGVPGQPAGLAHRETTHAWISEPDRAR